MASNYTGPNDPDFTPNHVPVTSEDLRTQGLSETFLGYMRGWAGFIVDPVEQLEPVAASMTSPVAGGITAAVGSCLVGGA